MTQEQQQYLKALPQMHPETETFFKAGQRSELVIKRCSDCGKFHHYPRAVCPNCLSDRTIWIRATGKGTVYSFNIVRQNPSPGWREEVPYVIAFVDLEEGVRMLTNIIDCNPEDVHVGMPVEVTFERVEDMALPKFRPARRR